MADGKTILTCTECGKQFQFPTPTNPGRYSVPCSHCGTKNHFKVPEGKTSNPTPSEPKAGTPNPSPSQPKDKQPEPPKQPKQPQQPKQLGFLEDGSYRFICEKETCKQSVLVPAAKIKTGHNVFSCPKCQTQHEFDKEPTLEELLCCQTADCKGKLEDPGRGDGLYTVECPECHAQYKIIVIDNKIVKVQNVTPPPPPIKKQFPMKLSIHSFFGNKEYKLTKGTHFVGRMDEGAPADFMVKDQYASARSLKIEVNQIGENVVYKLTVIKAKNPVYHNSKELVEGDIIYLNYGDTIKIGKTLIKVKKICK